MLVRSMQPSLYFVLLASVDSADITSLCLYCHCCHDIVFVVRSLAPIQCVGLSVRITCASCKIVVQEMGAPTYRCYQLAGELVGDKLPEKVKASWQGSWRKGAKDAAATLLKALLREARLVCTAPGSPQPYPSLFNCC